MRTLLILRKSILITLIPFLVLNITGFTMKILHWYSADWLVIASACISVIFMLMLLAWLIITLFGFNTIIRKAQQV